MLYSTLRWIEKDNCLVSGFSQIPASPCALCTLLPFSSLHKNVSKVRRQPGETFAVLALQKTLGLNISHSSPKITHPQKKNPKRQQCTFSFQEINHDLQGSLYLKLKHEYTTHYALGSIRYRSYKSVISRWLIIIYPNGGILKGRGGA